MLAALPDIVLGQPVFELQQEANGETVERAVRQTQKTEAVKATIGLAGFAMGLVGLWGDRA